MNAMERAQIVRAGIERAFLARGGTPEQWARVAADPRRFNLAWNRLLGLPDSTMPPRLILRTSTQARANSSGGPRK
jgi:hypothetical protein